MGILFQKSCFQVPDAIFKAIDPGRIGKRSKRRLQARRRRQFKDMVDEARAWMYMMLLPTEMIANGDDTIKENLDAEIAILTTKLLGEKIDHDKVDEVCGKLAYNILISGTANLDSNLSTNSRYYPSPGIELDEHYLNDKYIKAEFLEIIYNYCEGFQRQHPDVRTWSEIRQVAGLYTLSDEPLQDVLNEWQEHMTNIELGIPYLQSWCNDEKKAVYTRIRSADPLQLTGFRPAQRDLILVREGGLPAPASTAAASLDTVSNVLTLFPGFLGQPVTDSLRGLSMKAEVDSLHETRTNVGALLHELTHSKDILFTQDHEFAYGLEACLILAHRDKKRNLNKAEDNADNWAYYFTLRVLLLAYPELDILKALDTSYKDIQYPWIVEEREEWLHHCTLFNVLRHASNDDFRRGGRVDYYDDSKDWCMQDENLPTPKSLKHLLITLRFILDSD